jgi:hypothetical protein
MERINEYCEFVSNHLEQELSNAYKGYLKGDSPFQEIGMLYVMQTEFNARTESFFELFEELRMINEIGWYALNERIYGEKLRSIQAFDHFKEMYFNNDEFDVTNPLSPLCIGGIYGTYDHIKEGIEESYLNEFIHEFDSCPKLLISIPELLKEVKNTLYLHEDYKEMYSTIKRIFNVY